MEQIGHYRVVSELGRGGMGVVYKAHEESLNRFVAIKVLGEHLESDTEYVERFVREARSAAALSHPNIVQIYAIDEEDGQHYFVMEYVQGTSVQRMIQTRGKLEPAEAARLILQAAAGLQEAHDHGVIHRDIKPANLMVTDRGLVKIADFGLALTGSATTRLTATGMLMGTPGYLSPEQCLDQSPDHRTDIYSLGVTFFEMVTGTMPFRADSPLALLKLIVEVDPPDVGELNPEVDDELRAIIARMLAKDRDARYSSCSEIIDALTAWLESRGHSLHAAGIAAGSTAGVLPPPPPAVSDNQINTDPTVAVASGSIPPPPATAPAKTATAPSPSPVAEPAPEAMTPSTAPRPGSTGRRLGLAVAAVAVILLLGGAAVAYLVIAGGVLDGLLGGQRNDVAVAEHDEAAEVDASPATDASGVVADERSEVANPGAATLSPDPVPETVANPPRNEAAQPEPAPAPATAESVERRTDAAEPADAGSAAVESKAAAAPPKPRIIAPPPTGTVVLAVGESLFAVEAESYVKDRLRRAGVEVVEVTDIPGLEGFVNTDARPGPEKVRAALRPYARYLVALRVEYLGERAIYYMGQQDVVFSSRIDMGLVDLATGRPVGRRDNVKVEYTKLNATEVAAKQLRRPTTALLKVLPRR